MYLLVILIIICNFWDVRRFLHAIHEHLLIHDSIKWGIILFKKAIIMALLNLKTVLINDLQYLIVIKWAFLIIYKINLSNCLYGFNMTFHSKMVLKLISRPFYMNILCLIFNIKLLLTFFKIATSVILNTKGVGITTCILVPSLTKRLSF